MVASIENILADFMQLHPRVIDLSLHRMFQILEKLGNPHLNLPPVIHIAGTNGKGSTQAMLSAMLRAQGYAVDSYISPHLVTFNERILVNGKPVEDGVLIDALTHCQRVNGAAEITFFEITTACAFHIFAQNQADILILETGLGGRLDATNVIASPLATVITAVDMDHQDFLGHDLAQIASEKAGILKKDIPCISAPQKREVQEILIKKAQHLSAPLLIGERDWFVLSEDIEGCKQHSVSCATTRISFPTPALAGGHQLQNAGLALTVLDQIKADFPVDAMARETGLKQLYWPARFQKISKGPLCDNLEAGVSVWLDGGHNPAAGQVLARVFEDQDVTEKSIYVLINMVDRKDARGFLKPLLPYIKRLAVLSYTSDHQQQDQEVFADICATADIAYDGVFSSWTQIRGHWPLWQRPLKGEDAQKAHLLVCGSLYLAGHVLKTHS